MLDPVAAAAGARPRPLLPLRRRRRGARRGRPRRPRDVPLPALHAARRSSATRVVADWDATPGGSRPGRTSRARSRCTASPPPRSACAGDQLRLLTPPDSGGSFGIKSSVFAYVVLIGLAVAQARRARALDRGPARAPRRRARRRPAASTEVEAGFTADGELLALRYDAIEDVGAYVRAPEPATLYRMHGSLSGAYRVRNVAVRNRVVLTNTLPSGLNRGFGGPQLYFGLERTMAIAARRLGLDPAELARRNLVPADGDAVPHAVRRRSTTPATTRPASTTRSSSPATTSCARRGRGGARRGPARRDRARLRRRAVDLEHGLHHARADRRRARRAAAEVRQRRGRVGRDRPARRDHRATRDDAAGPGPPHGVRAGRRRRARLRPRRRRRCCPRWTPRRSPWTVASGNYSSRFSGVARRRGAGGGAEAARRRSMRSARTSATPSLSLRRVAGMAHWNPEALPTGDGAGSRTRSPSGRAPNLDPPDERTASPRRPRTASSSTSASSRSTRETGAVTRARLRHRPRRRAAAQPAARRRAGARRLRARRRRRAVRAPRLRRVGQPADGVARRLPRPDGARHPARCTIGHRSSPSPVHAARREGDRRGEHDERARLRSRTRSPTRSARDDVELPLTPPRVWELLDERRPREARRRSTTSRPESLEEALARARERRRGREADRRRPEPRPGAEHAPRPPDAPRRPQPRRARRGSSANGVRARRRHRAPGGARARRARTPAARARPSRSSATSSRATAAPSAASSPTRTARPSSRSASPRSAGRSSSTGRPGAARSRPDEFFVTHFMTTLEPGELARRDGLAAARGGEGERVRGVRPARTATTPSRWSRSSCSASTTARADVRIRVGAVTDRPTRLAEVDAAVEGRSAHASRGARRARSPRGRRPGRLDPRDAAVPARPHGNARRARAAPRLGAGGVIEIALTVNGRGVARTSSRGCC